MQKSIISEGKTSTEAIEKGLKELGLKKDDVDVKILEEDKKAFYDILAPRVVKVELTVKDEHKESRPREKKEPTHEEVKNCKEKIENFLNDFCKIYSNIEYTLDVKDNEIFININGKDCASLIGYRGNTINAIQTLLSAIGNKDNKEHVRIIVDIENYRDKRADSLKVLAKNMEKKVERTGKKVTLEPMCAYERKVIHTELQNSDKVTTYSIGVEPHRKIVIDLK